MSDFVCDAGRTVFYQGRWRYPCLIQPARHRLAFSATLGGDRSPGSPTMNFCDHHMEQLIFDGVVDEVLVENDEWERRVGGEAT